MPTSEKIDFDPKVNFELPREIGPLLEQTASVSIAETEDACYEFAMAAQDTLANFEKQFAVAQADAKAAAEKLWSAATQNIDAAFEQALRLVQANTIQDCIELQAEFIRTHTAILMKQTEDLSRSLAKFAAHS
jgi:hypothetical protein